MVNVVLEVGGGSITELVLGRDLLLHAVNQHLSAVEQLGEQAPVYPRGAQLALHPFDDDGDLAEDLLPVALFQFAHFRL